MHVYNYAYHISVSETQPAMLYRDPALNQPNIQRINMDQHRFLSPATSKKRYKLMQNPGREDPHLFHQSL